MQKSNLISWFPERSTDSRFVIADQIAADGSWVISLPSSWSTRRFGQCLSWSGSVVSELFERISVSSCNDCGRTVSVKHAGD